MLRSLAAAFVLFTCHAFAQVRMPATSLSDLNDLKAIARQHSDAWALTAATQGRYPTAVVNGRCTVGFLGKVDSGFDPSAVDPSVVRIGSRIGDIVSFRIDAQQLDAVHDIPGLVYAELAGCVKPSLDRLVKAVRADSVHMGIGLPQPYTGDGVLIGITDWGFDYTHPMFYDTTLTTSRVRAAWDQFRQAGPAPVAYGYGAEFTTPAALLAAQSDTANIYSWATHGSHVAGIAGGSGAGTPYRGVAFDAQFLFCTFLVDAAAVLDAYAWMKAIADADGKRLVVNMSWGLYWMGTLDGTSLISQAIDQYSADGITFVNSGGNNGSVDFHIEKTFTGDTLKSRVQFYPYSAHPSMWGQSLSMWGDIGGAFSAGFQVLGTTNQVLQQTPMYHTATQPAYLDSILVQGNDTIFFNLTAEAAHPLNGRPHFRLRVKNTNTAYKILLKATAPNGTVHFWNVTELSNDVGNWGQAFLGGTSGWTAGDHFRGISEPACTESLIAVAAYVAEYTTGGGSPAGGAIASFSSFGPTLDGRIKPDIAAPGSNVTSSISSFTDNDFTPVTTVDFMGNTYPFAKFSGTSMSAPAVTGVVALLLEADPTLTTAEVKQIIKTTARTDSYTGVIPPGGSTRWGMGKVNAYRAVQQALGLVGVHETEAEGMLVWPVPADEAVHILVDAPGPLRVEVRDITGRLVHQGNGNTSGVITIDLRMLPAAVYTVALSDGGALRVTRFVKR